MRIFIVLIYLLFVGCNSVTQKDYNNNQNNSNSNQNSLHVGARNIDYYQKYINEKCDQIIDKSFYKICYDYELNIATAVGYELDGELVDSTNIKDRPEFYTEPSLPNNEKVQANNYIGSGYDRGHMAPDAAFDWSQDSLESTYSMANIVPQIAEVNREEWSKAEEHARKMAKKYGTIIVVNYIVFSKEPQRVGESEVAVPKGFYKILYNSNENYKECFYYENVEQESKNLTSHIVNCDSL